MAECGELTVRRRGEPHPADRGRPVPDQREYLSPGQHQLHRLAQRHRRERSQHRLAMQHDLRAEAAADIGAVDADQARIDPERLAEPRGQLVDHLRGEMKVEVPVAPVGDARMELHRLREMVGRGVGLLHRHRPFAHRLVDIACPRRPPPLELRSEPGKGKRPRLDLVFYRDQPGRRPCLLKALGHHEADRLAVIVDLVGRQLRPRPIHHVAFDALGRPLLGRILMRPHQPHPRRRLGGRDVDPRHPALADAGPEDEAMERRPGLLPLGRIGGPPGDLDRPVGAADALPDHGRTSVACASVALSVRRTRGSL